MKTNIRVCIVSLLLSVLILTSFQKSADINAKISYNMITNLRGAKIEQPSELVIQGHESIFNHSKGKEGIHAIEVEIKQPDGSMLKTEDGYWQDSIGSVFYKNFKEKRLIIREIVWMQPYLAEEPQLPKIKWTILNEQKKINDFNCQKATSQFRGRNYTAWFTSKIPCSDGPWKLHGLPGLILEAYDDKDEVRFIATSIEIPYTFVNKITPPINGKKVAFNDYKRADDIEFQKMKRNSMSTSERTNSVEIKRVNVNLLEKEY